MIYLTMPELNLGMLWLEANILLKYHLAKMLNKLRVYSVLKLRFSNIFDVGEHKKNRMMVIVFHARKNNFVAH